MTDTELLEHILLNGHTHQMKDRYGTKWKGSFEHYISYHTWDPIGKALSERMERCRKEDAERKACKERKQNTQKHLDRRNNDD